MTVQVKTNLASDMFRKITDAVYEELIRATAKFPEFPVDMVHRSAIVAEEAGELVQASLDYAYGREKGPDKIREEAIQTAAMAFRILLHIGV